MIEKYYNSKGKIRYRVPYWWWPFMTKLRHDREMQELRDAINKFYEDRMDRLLKSIKSKS